jgi:hypothetical protein
MEMKQRSYRALRESGKMAREGMHREAQLINDVLFARGCSASLSPLLSSLVAGQYPPPIYGKACQSNLSLGQNR